MSSIIYVLRRHNPRNINHFYCLIIIGVILKIYHRESDPIIDTSIYVTCLAFAFLFTKGISCYATIIFSHAFDRLLLLLRYNITSTQWYLLLYNPEMWPICNSSLIWFYTLKKKIMKSITKRLAILEETWNFVLIRKLLRYITLSFLRETQCTAPRRSRDKKDFVGFSWFCKNSAM